MTLTPHDHWCRYVSGILSTLASTNQHEEVLHLVVDRLVRLYGCQTCAVVLIDPKTEYLCIDNCQGLSLTFCNAFRRRFATASIGELLWTRNTILIGDAAEEPERSQDVRLEHDFVSCLCVQIAADHRTLGYLHLDSSERNRFSRDDIPAVQAFADIAALAITKSHLFEENRRLETVDKESGLEKYGPFLEKLGSALEEAKTLGKSLSLLILDIDNFKDVVNTYGYDASRQLLREVAGIVKSRLRPIDAAGRYGFDEFIVMLPETDLDEALGSAKDLLQAIKETPFTGHKFSSSVSIGVASFPRNGAGTDDVITSAKHALFEAQRKGRNNVFSFAGAWYTREAVEEQG